ncbi:MAG: MarR family transcriptional regulator, partial [Candidatus Aminicenantes bacterium]|nr:MarR family transcriptional regulator [Candidatus Aminicenantes bacterium]
ISIGRRLGYLHRQAQRYFHREFSRLGIGGGTHSFLMFLYHHDGVTQQELSHCLHFDKAHTTRAIQKLIDLGYIIKEKNPEDQRAYRIYLTEKAHAVKPEIKKVLQRWTDLLASGFSAQERETAIGLLTRMTENVAEIGQEGK